MKKLKTINICCITLTFLFIGLYRITAQEAAAPVPSAAQSQAGQAMVTLPAGASSMSQNITLDFKEADINSVLKIISYKSGVNIVTTPDVIGNITIRLVDVPWEKALDVILRTYGYGYERQGNIILVTKAENISKIQADEPLKTEIINLKFLDAQDAAKIIIPLLSTRGKISILYARGQKGWEFGTFRIGKEEIKAGALTREAAGAAAGETISIERTPTGDLVSKKAEFENSVKSKTLIITDTAASLDRIINVILPQIDRKPRQVLIETRIMEVNQDKLRDLGLDWGTGSSGAHGYQTPPGDVTLDAYGNTIAGRKLGSEITPSVFGPKEGSSFTGSYPYSTGLEILFKKLAGTNFEVILHALEEDVHTNTLSAPRILTLDNQEASILIGYHTPILLSTVTAGTTSGTGAVVTQTLDYYQEIGIRLNVVPQVSQDGYINMIIHPSVTSSSSNVTATSTVSGGPTTTTSYPIIDVREAQTQVMIKNGETIVIGGLLKDVIGKEKNGIPFLSKIPLVGGLFERETNDITKVDLLIFITARIVNEEDFTPEEIAKLQQRLRTIDVEGKALSEKKQKKAKKNKKANP